MDKTIENLKKLKSFHNGSYGADIDKAIKALEQTRWIPVSERLPKPQEYGDEDYSDWVQITLHIGEDNDIVCSGYYCFNKRKWYADRLGVGVVTAWKPLPKSYRVESEE